MSIKYCSDVKTGATTQFGSDHDMHQAALDLGNTGTSTSSSFARTCTAANGRAFFNKCGFSNAIFYNSSGEQETSHILYRISNQYYFILNDETLRLTPVDSYFLLGIKFVSHRQQEEYTQFVVAPESSTSIDCSGTSSSYYGGIDEVNLVYENIKAFLSSLAQYFPSFIKASQKYTKNNTETVYTENDKLVATADMRLYQTDMPNFLVNDKSIRGVYNLNCILENGTDYNQAMQRAPSVTSVIRNPTSGREVLDKKALGYTEAIIPVYTNYGLINDKNCSYYDISGDTLTVTYNNNTTDTYVLNNKSTLVRYRRFSQLTSIKWYEPEAFGLETASTAIRVKSGWSPNTSDPDYFSFQIKANCTYRTQYGDSNEEEGVNTTDAFYNSMGKDASTKSKTYTGSTNGDGWYSDFYNPHLEMDVGAVGYDSHGQCNQPLSTTGTIHFSITNYKDIRGFSTSFPSGSLTVNNRVPTYKHQEHHNAFTYGGGREHFAEDVYYNSNANDFMKLEITNSSVIPPGLLPNSIYYPLLNGGGAEGTLGLSEAGRTIGPMKNASGDYSYDSTYKVLTSSDNLERQNYVYIAEESNSSLGRTILRISTPPTSGGNFNTLFLPIDTFYFNFSGADTDPLEVIGLFTETYIEEQ